MNLEYIRYVNKYAGTYQFEFIHGPILPSKGKWLVNRINGGVEFSPAPNVPAIINSEWIIYGKRLPLMNQVIYHNYHGPATINLQDKSLSSYRLNGVFLTFKEWQHFISHYTEKEIDGMTTADTYKIMQKISSL